MGVRFRQPMVRWQGWEIHEGHEGARRVGRETKGGEGHEGWGGARRVGRALRRELMGVHSCPDCDFMQLSDGDD